MELCMILIRCNFDAKIINPIDKSNYFRNFVPDMTKLYLIRHGQTVDNMNQIMQGQTQGELTDEGVRQAQELASQFADTLIDVFVSSDLKRSVDTCRIIADPRGKDVVQTPLLRERDWGSFTGRFIPDLILYQI